MSVVSVAAVLAAALGSIAAAPPDSTINLLPWTQPTTWDIQIAPPDEPGPRFEMSGRVLGADSIPQRGVHLYVYHADSVGWYAHRGQKFNRIAGVLATNDRGEYRFRSILPGVYEGTHPHVHIEVWKGAHPASSTFFNLVLAQGGADWSYGRLHTATMTRDSAGVYHCRKDIVLSAMMACPASYDSMMQAERKQLERPAGRSLMPPGRQPGRECSNSITIT